MLNSQSFVVWGDFLHSSLLGFVLGFNILFSPLSLGAIRVEQVEAWAQSHPEAQLEDFLSWVKSTDPEQMAWFTLMRKSESAQGATPLNPRAIVFGPESKFVFTFNGEAKEEGYQEVEMLFFRQEPKPQWELRKLSFNSQNKKVSFSGPNPNSCLACHQNPVRPIWSQYDTWKGAYGEFDDSIVDHGDKKEFLQFNKFLKNKETHSRYSKLQFPEGSIVSPYSEEPKGGNYRLRPNAALTDSLLKLHAKVLVARLKEHPEFETEKMFLTASLLGCEALLTADDFEKKILFGLSAKRFKKFYRGSISWGDKGSVGANSNKQAMLYLLGLEHSDFSLEKEPTRWSYFSGNFNFEEYLAIELYEELSQLDCQIPSFQCLSNYGHTVILPIGTEKDTLDILDACDYLFSSRMTSGPIEANGPKPISNPIVTCLGCHQKDGTAPYIPFDDKERLLSDKILKDLILSKITSKDKNFRMPPTRPLSEKEILGIREWLSN